MGPGGGGGTPAPGNPPPAGSIGGSAGSAMSGAGAGAGSGTSGSGGTGGSAGSVAPVVDAGMVPVDAGGGDSGVDAGSEDPNDFAKGLHELFIHDACTGEYPPQPDTCLHMLRIEKKVTFGGEADKEYDLTLRVRGIFEPTTINGGQVPMPQHPYFKVGGTVAAADYSRWHIEVSKPAQTYWLNHYPSTSHTIYLEDFEATLRVAGGADVTVRVIDGNDREIDNAEMGPADRRKKIDGVTPEVLDGQMLRLDVISVKAR